jgi:hypothetical protein
MNRGIEQMKIEKGRRIALAVDAKWYKAVEEHAYFLKGSKVNRQPLDLLMGTVESVDMPLGMWIRADERFTHFPMPLFIPWQYIFSAALLGPDEEKKLAGFAKKTQVEP